MNVRIAPSPIHGRGVFANENLKENDWSFVHGDIRKVLPGDPVEVYGIEWDDEKTFIPYAPFCCCNHSDTPNCEVSEYDGHGDVMVIGTLRDIAVDEEITLDYGYDPSTT